MKKYFLVILVTAVLIMQAACQETASEGKEVPVIKARSILVDIKDDGELRKGAWRISPEEALDVYTTSSKEVAFYTDIDSITFKIDPEVGEYSFIILLNEKDSARTQIKYQQSYLEKLKKGSEYSYSDKRFVPKLTYQLPDNPNLVRVRELLKLDSIAGNGDELSQIFNLLHWLHDLVKHDGNSDNPTIKNAIDLINVCKKENRGINCRMLATVLNECYLAMGIKSRFITCMPRETDFDDCHVINMVFSKELDKWIWIDPTFAAYVMDENGSLLGIQEVRERLINGQPLVLNADANWNREHLQAKKDYLESYMAKNLYRLQVPVSSEYNAETSMEGKKVAYIELLPLEGIEQEPQVETIVGKKSGVEYTYYKTNNPDIFWAKPE